MVSLWRTQKNPRKKENEKVSYIIIYVALEGAKKYLSKGRPTYSNGSV